MNKYEKMERLKASPGGGGMPVSLRERAILMLGETPTPVRGNVFEGDLVFPYGRQTWTVGHVQAS